MCVHSQLKPRLPFSKAITYEKDFQLDVSGTGACLGLIFHRLYWHKSDSELSDGVLATFTNVTDAVVCACSIQKAVASLDGLKLCIGIHQGEVVFEDGCVLGECYFIRPLYNGGYHQHLDISNRWEFQHYRLKE
jgi:hypothetical protein